MPLTNICKLIRHETKVATTCFTLSLLVFSCIEIVCLYHLSNILAICGLFTLLFCAIISSIYVIYVQDDFQIAIRASFLGTFFALGVYIYLATPSYVQIFGIYMCVMAFFHFSEYIVISLIQPQELSTNSFLINHSPQYNIAAVTSWIEFFLEAYFLAEIKKYHWISYFGLLVCILGELLRKISMLTAGTSFNHVVAYEKSSKHHLVTNGVYAWFRHPSYVGWFYWSIATQIVLINPFCILAYAAASWMFFNGRIIMEEITLLNFYGQHYCDYQKKVSTGIPFIMGYRIN
ncbi:unnamed protein product [Brassicogethes aeneus]|uniref:Protein-S-isoprenylcysteine O-methyltransferase n=1 Tax=Brassicogethes aeneus TaxID=1431903 RepID=A0A9P0B8K7_BRAAE|nr:unnamed protein product [Brassicogethes aeneus]